MLLLAVIIAAGVKKMKSKPAPAGETAEKTAAISETAEKTVKEDTEKNEETAETDEPDGEFSEEDIKKYEEAEIARGENGDEYDPATVPVEEEAKKDDEETAEAYIPDRNDWRLILVNRWNPIPDDYVIGELTELTGGNAIDSRAYPDLQAMFDDMRAEGLTPGINSSFRTTEDQQRIMDEKIAEYVDEGYSEEEAKSLAESWVAIPGRSEHQLGLSLDIGSETDADEDAWAVWDWLLTNSYKYGFIRRYPEEKTEITGVINEPWHFRYVGKEAAAEIYEQGVCLEEYLGQTR